MGKVLKFNKRMIYQHFLGGAFKLIEGLVFAFGFGDWTQPPCKPYHVA